MTPTPHEPSRRIEGRRSHRGCRIGRDHQRRRAPRRGAPRRTIDGVLRQAVDAKEVPGVVAMAATDKGVLYEGAFGLRALDQSTPMTLDTVFRIASMTKAITSVAAMQLVEQGKLKLDEPVPNIDPALGSPQVLEGFDAAGAPKLRPAKRPITLRHLLTHTAGFSYDIWDADTGRYIKAAGMPARPPARWRRSACRWSSIRATAGSTASTPTGSGRLVEAISGQSLDVYFRDKIFAPLGMKDSGYVVSPSSARARPACTRARPTARSRPSRWEAAPVQPRVLVGRRPALLDGARLPDLPADAAARRKLSTARGSSSRRRSRR